MKEDDLYRDIVPNLPRKRRLESQYTTDHIMMSTTQRIPHKMHSNIIILHRNLLLLELPPLLRNQPQVKLSEILPYTSRRSIPPRLPPLNPSPHKINGLLTTHRIPKPITRNNHKRRLPLLQLCGSHHRFSSDIRRRLKLPIVRLVSITLELSFHIRKEAGRPFPPSVSECPAAHQAQHASVLDDAIFAGVLRFHTRDLGGRAAALVFGEGDRLPPRGDLAAQNGPTVACACDAEGAAYWVVE